VLSVPRGSSGAIPPRTDDWTCRSPIPPSPVLLAAFRGKHDDVNSGIRREPELPQHEEIAASPTLLENEFDAGPEEPDAEAVQASVMSPSMQGIARAVSLDPDDGMGL
jgi:type IV secretion system protein VirD4